MGGRRAPGTLGICGLRGLGFLRPDGRGGPHGGAGGGRVTPAVPGGGRTWPGRGPSPSLNCPQRCLTLCCRRLTALPQWGGDPPWAPPGGGGSPPAQDGLAQGDRGEGCPGPSKTASNGVHGLGPGVQGGEGAGSGRGLLVHRQAFPGRVWEGRHGGLLAPLPRARLRLWTGEREQKPPPQLSRL